jgi:hypothetical protein
MRFEDASLFPELIDGTYLSYFQYDTELTKSLPFVGTIPADSIFDEKLRPERQLSDQREIASAFSRTVISDI